MEAIKNINQGYRLSVEQQHLLYKSYYTNVYRTAFYIVKDRCIAEDLTNDAYILAFEKIHTLKDSTKFKSWICTIVANLAKDYLKKNNRINLVESFESYFESYKEEKSVEEDALNRLEQENIKEIISDLDSHYQNVIVLRYYHDLSYKSIARKLNLNDNTVKTRLKRAKGKLLKLLL